MGLAITVGQLVELKELDEEGADWFRQQLREINRVLRANGLPEHTEPEELPRLEDRSAVGSFGYSWLHYLRRAVPVADYRSMYKMSPQQHLEWALMDTHDGLITRYTFPQRWRDIERWTAGLDRVRRTLPDEIAMVGQLPDHDPVTVG